MEEVRDLSLNDLLAGGRRWVIAPGDYAKGEGYRTKVIVEKHPFPFVMGQITDMPSLSGSELPCFPAPTDSVEARDAAKLAAARWCERHLGIDRATYLSIIASSMKAYQYGKRVRVLGESSEELVIVNGFGDRIELDMETATQLHRNLAVALDLPCQRQCPICREDMDGDHCEECST